MPSLVYITRIRPLSMELAVELARGLESAGFHLKSFGPGEITADECLLVMTSEAALAGVQASEAAGSGESGGVLRIPGMHEDLEPQAEVWKRIKAAAMSESGVNESPVSESAETSQPHPSAGPAVPGAILGLVPSQAGARVRTALERSAVDVMASTLAKQEARSESLANPVDATRPLPSPGKTTPGNPTKRSEWASILSSGRRHFAKVVRPANGKRQVRLWQAATAGALLVLAAVLLTSHASILPARAGGNGVEDTKQTAQSNSEAAGSIRKASVHSSRPAAQPANSPEASAKTSNSGAEFRGRISDYGFVAEDYTTHFDLHAHREVTLHPPGLQRGERNQFTPKRIVVD